MGPLLWIFLLSPSLAEQSAPREGFRDKLPLPRFAASWLDDRTTYQAGDIATIKIKPMDNSFNNSNFNPDRYAVNFSLSVSGKKGNSSCISGVVQHIEGHADNWKIIFIPIQSGNFSVIVTEEYSGIADSSLHFSAVAGHVYPSASMVFWTNSIDEFVAGTKAYVSIIPKDAFGNNILPITNQPRKDYFVVFAYFENGSLANVLDLRYNGWNELGYIGIEYVPTTAGSLILHVFGDNQTLRGCPLPFVVRPGSLNITNSVAKWKYETSSLQIFSMLEICIYQQDQYGNPVPGFHPFDAEVVEKATNLSIPVADLLFQEVEQGVQLLSFIVSEPGDFSLTICSAKLKECIANMPYHFTVFTGYCNGSNSIVNGSGLFGSVAGTISYFTVYLEDMYSNPSPVEAERLHVQILSKNGLFGIDAVIFPLSNFTGHDPAAENLNLTKAESRTAQAELARKDNNYLGRSSVQTSDFNVAYKPDKSGAYEVRIFCGNIPLNNGNSYLMDVSPGVVDPSLSSVVKYLPRTKRFEKNDILVQLRDSYSNPTPSHETKLSFQFVSYNSSVISSWSFVDNGDGSYVGYYLARDLGAYNICILFEDKHLSPCPFEINVSDIKYFPEACDDMISVWEDESVAFDVLSNDYIAGGQASIIESSKPIHGSLLQYGLLFRYTPYGGFFGNDSFSYTISDENKNVATGTTFLSILCKPPQFISIPLRLHVTEDIMSPKFGGFPGFKIHYSDITESISVTIRAKYGAAFLAPIPMEVWQPLGGRLSVSKGGKAGRDLILAGYVEFINSALQFIQYLGNVNFNGNDIISLYAMNKNGIQDAHVPIFVEPVNDPPIIYAPKFIVLARKELSDNLQIFDKQRDAFEFSVADPDLYNFPDNKSHFMVIFSLEVNDGVISTSLPAYLLNTTELKIKDRNQWQPLQTFVTISNHFSLRGKGIRFRGTIGDCNNAMQRMFYQGSNDDALLTIRVNDLGNYGCDPDWKEMMAIPLSTEISVNLIKRRPISSMTSLLLGSAIVVEIVMMLLLGGVLLYFICKCMNILHKERREYDDGSKIPTAENLQYETQNVRSSAPLNVAYFDGCTNSFPTRIQHSEFRQRSCRVR